VSFIVRVDDRLVHGQVVVGWGQAAGLRHLVLVDDGIRASAWEQDLYRMGVPGGMDIEFASVAEAGTAFGRWRGDGSRTMLIVADVGTLARLCAVADVRQVQLGGIHQGPGRRERLPYVFLSDDEVQALKALEASGVEITAQDVPSRRPVPLEEIVR
jgi:PTS system mannose-specific IIB component/fructoselysine and glucoselysine-specific PTS system IIB component